MAKLELEITGKLTDKLQQRAEEYAVEPSDVAKSIISCELAKRKIPSWFDKLATMVEQVGNTMVAASKMGTREAMQPLVLT